MAQAAELRRKAKPRDLPLSKEQLVKAYHDMLLIRRFEEKAGQLYGMGLIGGFCHLYIGQEAVVVGMQIGARPRATRSSPPTATTATCWRPAWTRSGVMAELTGRATGYSHGKGGSMHMFSKEKNFFGGHGIVGAQVSLGTGLAFANWYRGNDRVCADLFRRGRLQPGPGLRELQPRRADEAALRLRHREQQLRHGHQRRARLRVARPVEERRALGHPRRAGGRHGRGRGEGGAATRRSRIAAPARGRTCWR